MATAVLNDIEAPLDEEQLATRFAGTLVYRSLIELGEPVKASEVAKGAERPDVDLKLARVVLSTNPHMTAVDRKWTLWTRFLDARSTVDQNVRRVMLTFGQPMRIPHLARELTAIYGRPAEIFEEMLRQLARERSRYFPVGEDMIAPAEWLLNTDWENEDELLFENFLDDEDALPLVSLAAEIGFSDADASKYGELLDRAGKPLKGKALQFIGWRTNKLHFDPVVFFNRLFVQSGAQPLGEELWVGPELAARLAARFPSIAEQEVSDNAEAEAQEAAQPLQIGDEERDRLVQRIAESDETVFATRLLEEQFDITPDYRTYQEDLQMLIQTLATDERIVWVGADRFRPQGLIPPYVFSVPGLLEIPETNFVDAENNLVDLMLEDEGFDGGLDREILNPLAQDVLDEEPVPRPDPNPPSNARAVIKFHHKQIGTLPLCQFPSGFFAPEPSILEVEFVLPSSQKVQVWVNNDTRLLYGLLDWFQSIPIDSGATFTLERQAADRFAINYNEETEPSMFISRNRINELLELQERAEAEDLPDFDVMRLIMEHYRKGIEYVTLLTEVNIVRRVTRRMIASILSEYHCFFQRGGSWVFDTKKLIQGFDKTKRKFLAKF